MALTLNDISEAVEAKYASLEIELNDHEVLTLRNPLRLGEKERRELSAIQEDRKDESGQVIEKDTEESLEDVRKIVRLTADDKHLADKLLKHVGEDAASLMYIVSEYTEKTRTGEASPSAD